MTTLTESLRNSAEAANLQEKDQAALELARIYANRIDIAVINGRDTNVINQLGPKLHALLKDLGMTQAVTALKETRKEGEPSDTNSPSSKLTGLRARANRRNQGSAAA